MDIEDVKRIIRASLSSKLRQEARLRKSIPEEFNQFRRILSNALCKSGCPRNVYEAFEESLDLDVCGPIHEAWSSISMELNDIEDPTEKRKVWNEAVEFYVSDLISEIHTVDASSVISRMKR